MTNQDLIISVAHMTRDELKTLVRGMGRSHPHADQLITAWTKAQTLKMAGRL